MRRLSKVAEPQILADRGAQWTADYLAAQGTPREPQTERWRHDDIKQSLRLETSDRCAYCESYIENSSYPHVEHIRPKSQFPAQAHQWDNLTWACQRCNTNKGAYYSDTAPILNPYLDTPGEHLRFLGGLVLPELADDRATITVNRLDLNRAHLTHARNARVVRVRNAVEQWAISTGELREALALGIRRDAEEGEYSQSVFAMLREYNFPLN